MDQRKNFDEPIYLALAGEVPYRTVVSLRPGLCGNAHLVVTESDTALALRSGEVPVLGTPRLVALCEQATCAAVAGQLEPGCTTVASRVQFDHLAPSLVGSNVTAEATLEKTEGRRLVFTVSALDDSGLLGAGRITRVIVDTQKFLERSR